MMKRLAPLLLLFVVACATSVEGKLAQSCNTWGSLIFVAGDMIHADKLNRSQIDDLIAWRNIVRPVCRTDNPTDADIQTLRRAIRAANGMGVHKR